MDTRTSAQALERKNTRITEGQLIKMISMLETEPDIARAIARGPQNIFWRRIAKELNDIGPATKDPSSWKKVWCDYKCSIKKRLVQYNEDISAGVYPKHLSNTHRRILKLLDLEVKRIKLMEEYDSGNEREDMNGIDAEHSKDGFDMGDPMYSQSSTGGLGQTVLDDSTNLPGSSNFSNTINACQQRLAKMPNITITKQKNADEDDDPLSYCPKSASKPNPCIRATKRKREECFDLALETNRSLIAAMKTSLSVQKELVTEIRGLKKALEEFTENLKDLNDGISRNLVESKGK
uniref:Myb_DNA-bind_5 domain-containing protein n=1 Tax=Anopheles christyi TaxID=43041 RepID=A0A182KGS6_9DIPT